MSRYSKSEREDARQEAIKSVLRQAEKVRATLNPELLSLMTRILDKVRMEPAQQNAGSEAGQDIKIDRARNIEFVDSFINSPAGAHLKGKIYLPKKTR